jgi:hypothetical protein
MIDVGRANQYKENEPMITSLALFLMILKAKTLQNGIKSFTNRQARHFYIFYNILHKVNFSQS